MAWRYSNYHINRAALQFVEDKNYKLIVLKEAIQRFKLQRFENLTNYQSNTTLAFLNIYLLITLSLCLIFSYQTLTFKMLDLAKDLTTINK